MVSSERPIYTRITPACAGNTPTAFFFVLGIWDHPRMRGEYTLPTFVTVVLLGSPPHARGIRRIPAVSDAGPGITPACAGNTGLTLMIFRIARDHPRMRGEYQKGGCAMYRNMGSPPHARGIPRIPSRRSW